MPFSKREAKTAGPVIWVDLEPTKNGILPKSSDSSLEANQADCVDKATEIAKSD